MKILSVVCARAGSKGLRSKCIAKIEDKMVIEFSIEYSLSLGKYVKTVVSTDIDRLIDYCKKNRVDYIKRDPKLCRDDTRIEDVLADAIEKKGEDADYCSLVYGNIPTRYPEIFHRAIKFLEVHTDYSATISMQNVEKFHPEWMFDYNNEILPKKVGIHYRRQVLPQKMIHDGHTLVFKIAEFLERYKKLITYDSKFKYSIYGNKIKPLINNEVIIDIDTAKDLKLAEAVIKNANRHRGKTKWKFGSHGAK